MRALNELTVKTENTLDSQRTAQVFRPDDGAPAPGVWWSPRRGLGAPGRPLLLRRPAASTAERHHGNALTQASRRTVSC